MPCMLPQIYGDNLILYVYDEPYKHVCYSHNMDLYTAQVRGKGYGKVLREKRTHRSLAGEGDLRGKIIV